MDLNKQVNLKIRNLCHKSIKSKIKSTNTVSLNSAYNAISASCCKYTFVNVYKQYH